MTKNKLIYQLLPHEYGRYKEHLLALDAESRYLRFAFHISDENLAKYCEDSFLKHPLEHKIFVIEDSDLNIIAAGHIALTENETELAFSVLKEHRGNGYGSDLMEHCVEWCQNRGIKNGFMVCLANNAVIKHLAAKHGIISTSYGESTASLKIPDPTPISIWKEMLETRFANYDHIGKIQMRTFNKLLMLPLTFINPKHI